MNDLKYKIHSVNEDEVAAIAEIDGVKTSVKVPCLVVEALSSDGSMGHTFKIRGGKAADYPMGGDLTVRLIPGTAK